MQQCSAAVYFVTFPKCARSVYWHSFQKQEVWLIRAICESIFLFTVYSCVTLKSYFRKVKQASQSHYCWGSYSGAMGSQMREFRFSITFYSLHKWNQHGFCFSTDITDYFRQAETCVSRTKSLERSRYKNMMGKIFIMPLKFKLSLWA